MHTDVCLPLCSGEKSCADDEYWDTTTTVSALRLQICALGATNVRRRSKYNPLSLQTDIPNNLKKKKLTQGSRLITLAVGV